IRKSAIQITEDLHIVDTIFGPTLYGCTPIPNLVNPVYVNVIQSSHSNPPINLKNQTLKPIEKESFNKLIQTHIDRDDSLSPQLKKEAVQLAEQVRFVKEPNLKRKVIKSEPTNSLHCDASQSAQGVADTLIQSTDNKADAISRGCSTTESLRNPKWLHA